MSKDEMMTANEVALLLGVSRQAVSQAIREERLKATRWGKFYVVTRKEADRWAAHRRKKQQP